MEYKSGKPVGDKNRLVVKTNTVETVVHRYLDARGLPRDPAAKLIDTLRTQGPKTKKMYVFVQADGGSLHLTGVVQSKDNHHNWAHWQVRLGGGGGFTPEFVHKEMPTLWDDLMQFGNRARSARSDLQPAERGTGNMEVKRRTLQQDCATRLTEITAATAAESAAVALADWTEIEGQLIGLQGRLADIRKGAFAGLASAELGTDEHGLGTTRFRKITHRLQGGWEALWEGQLEACRQIAAAIDGCLGRMSSALRRPDTLSSLEQEAQTLAPEAFRALSHGAAATEFRSGHAPEPLAYQPFRHEALAEILAQITGTFGLRILPGLPVVRALRSAMRAELFASIGKADRNPRIGLAVGDEGLVLYGEMDERKGKKKIWTSVLVASFSGTFTRAAALELEGHWASVQEISVLVEQHLSDHDLRDARKAVESLESAEAELIVDITAVADAHAEGFSQGALDSKALQSDIDDADRRWEQHEGNIDRIARDLTNREMKAGRGDALRPALDLAAPLDAIAPRWAEVVRNFDAARAIIHQLAPRARILGKAPPVLERLEGLGRSINAPIAVTPLRPDGLQPKLASWTWPEWRGDARALLTLVERDLALLGVVEHEGRVREAIAPLVFGPGRPEDEDPIPRTSLGGVRSDGVHATLLFEGRVHLGSGATISKYVEVDLGPTKADLAAREQTLGLLLSIRREFDAALAPLAQKLEGFLTRLGEADSTTVVELSTEWRSVRDEGYDAVGLAPVSVDSFVSVQDTPVRKAIAGDASLRETLERLLTPLGDDTEALRGRLEQVQSEVDAVLGALMESLGSSDPSVSPVGGPPTQVDFQLGAAPTEIFEHRAVGSRVEAQQVVAALLRPRGLEATALDADLRGLWNAFDAAMQPSAPRTMAIVLGAWSGRLTISVGLDEKTHQARWAHVTVAALGPNLTASAAGLVQEWADLQQDRTLAGIAEDELQSLLPRVRSHATAEVEFASRVSAQRASLVQGGVITADAVGADALTGDPRRFAAVLGGLESAMSGLVQGVRALRDGGVGPGQRVAAALDGVRARQGLIDELGPAAAAWARAADRIRSIEETRRSVADELNALGEPPDALVGLRLLAPGMDPIDLDDLARPEHEFEVRPIEPGRSIVVQLEAIAEAHGIAVPGGDEGLRELERRFLEAFGTFEKGGAGTALGLTERGGVLCLSAGVRETSAMSAGTTGWLHRKVAALGGELTRASMTRMQSVWGARTTRSAALDAAARDVLGALADVRDVEVRELALKERLETLIPVDGADPSGALARARMLWNEHVVQVNDALAVFDQFRTTLAALDPRRVTAGASVSGIADALGPLWGAPWVGVARALEAVYDEAYQAAAPLGLGTAPTTLDVLARLMSAVPAPPTAAPFPVSAFEPGLGTWTAEGWMQGLARIVRAIDALTPPPARTATLADIVDFTVSVRAAGTLTSVDFGAHETGLFLIAAYEPVDGPARAAGLRIGAMDAATKVLLGYRLALRAEEQDAEEARRDRRSEVAGLEGRIRSALPFELHELQIAFQEMSESHLEGLASTRRELAPYLRDGVEFTKLDETSRRAVERRLLILENELDEDKEFLAQWPVAIDGMLRDLGARVPADMGSTPRLLQQIVQTWGSWDGDLAPLRTEITARGVGVLPAQELERFLRPRLDMAPRRAARSAYLGHRGQDLLLVVRYAARIDGATVQHGCVLRVGTVRVTAEGVFGLLDQLESGFTTQLGRGKRAYQRAREVQSRFGGVETTNLRKMVTATDAVLKQFQNRSSVFRGPDGVHWQCLENDDQRARVARRLTEIEQHGLTLRADILKLRDELTGQGGPAAPGGFTELVRLGDARIAADVEQYLGWALPTASEDGLNDACMAGVVTYDDTSEDEKPKVAAVETVVAVGLGMAGTDFAACVYFSAASPPRVVVLAAGTNWTPSFNDTILQGIRSAEATVDEREATVRQIGDFVAAQEKGLRIAAKRLGKLRKAGEQPWSRAALLTVQRTNQLLDELQDPDARLATLAGPRADVTAFASLPPAAALVDAQQSIQRLERRIEAATEDGAARLRAAVAKAQNSREKTRAHLAARSDAIRAGLGGMDGWGSSLKTLHPKMLESPWGAYLKGTQPSMPQGADWTRFTKLYYADPRFDRFLNTMRTFKIVAKLYSNKGTYLDVCAALDIDGTVVISAVDRFGAPAFSGIGTYMSTAFKKHLKWQDKLRREQTREFSSKSLGNGQTAEKADYARTLELTKQIMIGDQPEPQGV